MSPLSPSPCCSNRVSSNTPMRKGHSWETCRTLIHVAFLLPLLHSSLPDSFLTGYLSTTLSLALLCLKIRDHQEKGERGLTGLAEWASKALERAPARIFSSLPCFLQNAKPLFSFTTSYTLCLGSFPFQLQALRF